METNLFQAAEEYVKIVTQIEKTNDPVVLQALEEKRVELHWRFMGVLRQQGIKFKDRDHATQIAFRIVREEL